ncbi:MAG: RNA polymerase sigma factor [Chloroflexi bacterium]|nr:RNA polymerase sigma factor [Chloroflexota bacterium]
MGERRSPDGVVRLDADRRLVEEARSDPARFEALYRKYVAQVYAFALYELRDHHEAEDVTERTFMLALAGLPRFEERGAVPHAGRPDAGGATRGAAARPRGGTASVDDAVPDPADASSFRPWLFRIARNVVAGQRRTSRRRPTAPLELAAGIADPLDVAYDAELRDEARTAWSAVDRLPDDRRRAVVLRFVEEMSAAEIGEVLDRSEGAVRVLLHRALRAVAADLRRDESGRRDGGTP